MAEGYKLHYIGRKLVRANESLGTTKGKFYHTVELVPDEIGQNTIVQLVETVYRHNGWCLEVLGYGAFSYLPSDAGTWFKFKTKWDATQFMLAWA